MKHHNGKTWTVNGKIFLKTDLNTQVLKIGSYEDLRNQNPEQPIWILLLFLVHYDPTSLASTLDSRLLAR